jgi:hypothetical protein
MFLSLYIHIIFVINYVIHSYNIKYLSKTKIIIHHYHHYQQLQQYQYQHCLYASSNDYIDDNIRKDNNNNMIISVISDASTTTSIDNYNNDDETNKISNIDTPPAPEIPSVATVTPFQSLQQIGLNITSEIINRMNIPHLSITSNNIFCNIELNMEQIKAIGFDMDFTLAQYTIEFDLLAYNGAINKLIHYYNYPTILSNYLYYQRDISRRGCMIDKKRGNILKLDQHRYVRAVEHGLTPLSREERKSIYRESYQVP